jgi:hypothetical protein
MKRLVAVLFVCLAFVYSLHAGSVVVSGDELLFSSTGWIATTANDPAFASNLVNWLTGGTTTGGSILLVESGTFCSGPCFGPQFQAFLKAQGFTVTSVAVAPASYTGYLAVFTVGNNAANTVLNDVNLTAYVYGGGNVFLEAGTAAFGSATLEAAAWNPFLNNFGLKLVNAFNGILAGPVSAAGFNGQLPYGPDLFAGIANLYINNGQDIVPFGCNNNAQIFYQTVTGVTHGLYAAWRDSSPFIGGWTPLNNQPTVNVGAMLQLRDGRILVHEEQAGDARNWWILTPDARGSYINGTWSSGGSMPANYSPFYFSSQVLLDGQVMVEGGEYNFGSAVWTNQGACANVTPFGSVTWSAHAPPPGWTTIGDAPSVLLPNGHYMQANCCTTQTALADRCDTWTPTGAGKADVNGEEGWTLLPNDKVLTVDTYVSANSCGGTGASELYNLGTWTCGPQTTQLWDNSGHDIGPAVLMYNGKVIQFGAVPATAIYTPSGTGGSWTAGPTPAMGLDAADAPAALEPNGMVLAMLSPGEFAPGCQMVEYDPISGTSGTLTNTFNPLHCPADSSFQGHLMILPNGQIMFTDFSNRVEVYTPKPGNVCNTAPLPVITMLPLHLSSASTNNILYGQQLNGLTQNNAYGDDYQGDTNYPLVRLTDTSGNVFYGWTHDESTHSIAPGVVMFTRFDLPSLPNGNYDMVVIANGVASNPVHVNVP